MRLRRLRSGMLIRTLLRINKVDSTFALLESAASKIKALRQKISSAHDHKFCLELFLIKRKVYECFHLILSE